MISFILLKDGFGCSGVGKHGGKEIMLRKL